MDLMDDMDEMDEMDGEKMAGGGGKLRVMNYELQIGREDKESLPQMNADKYLINK